MKITVFIAAALISAPAFAASTYEPEKKPDESEQAKKSDETAEQKKICKRIAADMSSRRRTKVCLTRDEWKTFNRDQRRN